MRSFRCKPAGPGVLPPQRAARTACVFPPRPVDENHASELLFLSACLPDFAYVLWVEYSAKTDIP